MGSNELPEESILEDSEKSLYAVETANAFENIFLQASSLQEMHSLSEDI